MRSCPEIIHNIRQRISALMLKKNSLMNQRIEAEEMIRNIDAKIHNTDMAIRQLSEEIDLYANKQP